MSARAGEVEGKARHGVLEVMNAWADAFQKETPDEILRLYHREAVLWGTLSPVRRDTCEERKDYFLNAFKALPGHEVTFVNTHVRLYGHEFAVNSGCYTFSWYRNGKQETLPSRYSFTLVAAGGRWLIVDHHSSAMPTPDLVT